MTDEQVQDYVDQVIHEYRAETVSDEWRLFSMQISGFPALCLAADLPN